MQIFTTQLVYYKDYRWEDLLSILIFRKNLLNVGEQKLDCIIYANSFI
jgi:hypothetical protein